MDRSKVDEVVALFGLLGEPNRFRIVLACVDDAKGVGEIADLAGISPSLASHHLRLLRTARLLRAERQGKAVRYGIDDDHVREVVKMMVAHVCEHHENRTEILDPE